MAATPRQNIILIKTPTGEYEPWSNLKKSCQAYGWSYFSFAKKSLPIVTRDGFTIYRVNVQ